MTHQLKLEYQPTVSPRALMRLEHTYKAYVYLIESTERALNGFERFPKLKALVQKLRDTDAQLKEMLIAQAEKGGPVNIGGEAVNLVDTINDSDSSIAMVRRVSAKRLARRLYMIHHPDRGGSPSTFNLIRKAVKEGDLEMLLFFRMRDGVDTFKPADVDVLQKKIEIKTNHFKGKPAWSIASSYYSNSERYEAAYSELLEAKIYNLNMQMFGLTTNQEKQ